MHRLRQRCSGFTGSRITGNVIRSYNRQEENNMKRVFLATVLCVVNAVGLCACQGHNNGAYTQNMQERDFADMTEGYARRNR